MRKRSAACLCLLLIAVTLLSACDDTGGNPANTPVPVMTSEPIPPPEESEDDDPYAEDDDDPYALESDDDPYALESDDEYDDEYSYAEETIDEMNNDDFDYGDGDEK